LIHIFVLNILSLRLLKPIKIIKLQKKQFKYTKMPKTPYLYQNPFAINWEKNSKKSKFKHEIKKYKEQSYFFSIKRYILLALV
jgi:hypothetical protein